jgi:hypothetical protein
MHSSTPLPTEAPKATDEDKRQDLFLSASKSLLVTPKGLYSPTTLVHGLFTPSPSFKSLLHRRGSLPLKKRRVIANSEEEDLLFQDPPFRVDPRLLHHFQYGGGPNIPNEDDVKLPPSTQLRHWKLAEPYLPTYPDHSFHALDANQKKLVALMASPEASFPSYASSFDRVQSRSSSTYETHVSPSSDWKDGMSSPPGDTTSHKNSGTGMANDSTSQPPLHVVTPKPVKAAALPSSGNCLGQDKRYTGLSPDQVRCPATTTRGRPCAYQAVTKYCHLHADYDTHPPPRRKTREDDAASTASSTPTAVATTASLNSSTTSAATAEESSSRTGPSPVVSVASVESPAPGKRRHRTHAKWAVKHAAAPHPLLSMRATDQWPGQRVRVAVGPLTGQIGTVHKWGNGWITIFIPDVGYHNRRSFELYLVEEEEEDAKKTLFRCVSRDGVSPSPTPPKAEAWTPAASSTTVAVVPKVTPVAAPPSLSFTTGVFRPSVGERTRSTSCGSPSREA